MQLKPIIKRDMEIRSRGFLFPVLMTALNAVLFLVALLGSFGVISGMRQSYIADYHGLLQIYRITVLTQYILILLISPLYTLSAISGERETGTFDLLITTRLTSFDIVAEKMVSAFISVTVIIISCLPAMLIPLMYGGVPVQSAVGLMLLFIPEAFFMLSCGMFASAISRSVVRSTILSYGIVLGLAAGTVLLALLLKPFGVSGQNRAAYLLTMNPLTPVFSVVTRQTGDPNAVRGAFRLLGLSADNAYAEHIVLVSVVCQLAAAFAMLTFSVISITPGRRPLLRAGVRKEKTKGTEEIS